MIRGKFKNNAYMLDVAAVCPETGDFIHAWNAGEEELTSFEKDLGYVDKVFVKAYILLSRRNCSPEAATTLSLRHAGEDFSFYTKHHIRDDEEIAAKAFSSLYGRLRDFVILDTMEN